MEDHLCWEEITLTHWYGSGRRNRSSSFCFFLTLLDRKFFFFITQGIMLGFDEKDQVHSEWHHSMSEYNLMWIHIKLFGFGAVRYVLFNLGLGLIELDSNVGLWWKYALYWVPFYCFKSKYAPWATGIYISVYLLSAIIFTISIWANDRCFSICVSE